MLGGKQKHSRPGHRRRQVVVSHPGCKILGAQSNQPFRNIQIGVPWTLHGILSEGRGVLACRPSDLLPCNRDLIRIQSLLLGSACQKLASN